MRIGNLSLENGLILAPMAGVTDRPFRQLCRRMGAGLTVSEMVSSNPALRGTAKSKRRLDHSGETGPISVQILGNDPRAMADAARADVDLGAEIIDINMGCPAKKVCRVAAGSALLRDPPLVARILEAVVAAVPVPVTLKIRTGWAPEARNGVEIARIAAASGIAALAVHGRTRACGYGIPAEYRSVREIKRSLSIPVIANGDIDSVEKARFVLDYTGADAIMIGRAAQGRPWIFQEIFDYLETGALPRDPAQGWIKNTLLSHLQELYRFYGNQLGVRMARKHVAWYCKDRPGAERFREGFNRAELPHEQERLIEGFFDARPPREDKAA